MGTSAGAEPEVLDAYCRLDEAFPQFAPFWGSESNEADNDEGSNKGKQNTGESLGASLHVLVRNTDSRPIAIQDVLLQGRSLRSCLAFSDQRNNRKPASIFFANLPDDQIKALVEAGEPVWWSMDPRQIPPGGTGEVVVRLRRRPAMPEVHLTLKHDQGAVDASVAVRSSRQRIAGISFSPEMDKVHLYFRHPERPGLAPLRILLDGHDVTGQATIGRDDGFHTIPVILELSEPLTTGSFHCFQGVYDDGMTFSAGVRAYADDFAYGIWGGLPGPEGDVKTARRFIADITDHNINVQMVMVGSPAVQAYYNEPAGRQFCATRGLRHVIHAPGKWGVTRPFAYFIHDEPDCGDYRMKGLDADRKVGALAQWCVQRRDEIREADASRPQLLNLDMTFKPHNWYTYGQVPDVLSVDPYYQARLRTALWKHPERIPLYSDATYVYAVSAVAQSACEPKPLHVILYSCSYIDGSDKRRFRFPTPQEKRIEAYYALGAGAKGLSFWWYTPADKVRENKGGAAYGVGAATRDGDADAAALWREIGLLGAEIRTAGPLLLASCPADVPIRTQGALWVRALLVGVDTIILVIVNDQYNNDEKGTTCRPVTDARILMDSPSWMKPKDVFEVSASGTQDVDWKTTDSQVSVELGTVDLTRLLVVSSDAGLRDRLQGRHQELFASKVARLK